MKKEQAILQIIETDKAFSKLSEEKGMNAAFVFYADNDVIKLRDGANAIIGIEQMKKIMDINNPVNGVLTWVPLKADAAESGDMGYSFGDWRFVSKDSNGVESVTLGNYLSVWKKQSDGTWKYVIDGGNTTVKPQL